LYPIWNAQARSGDERLVVAHFPRSYQSHFFIREREIYPEHDYFLSLQQSMYKDSGRERYFALTGSDLRRPRVVWL
jgi:hypothetical protein